MPATDYPKELKEAAERLSHRLASLDNWNAYLLATALSNYNEYRIACEEFQRDWEEEIEAWSIGGRTYKEHR